MKNVKLTIQYDGTDYSGWQIQKDRRTIQSEIKKAINTVLREDVKLTGSGRTDAGVHALGQIANFHTSSNTDFFRFVYAVNSLLPDDIAVTNAEYVPDDFNARFSAVERRYLYLINHKKSPFYKRYAHFTKHKPDTDYLNELSALLIGKKEFGCFTKHASENDNLFCDIKFARWKRMGDFTLFYINADRFLHGMVRAISGTLLKYEYDRRDKNELAELIASGDRTEAGNSAPAKGLFLYKVIY